MKRLMLAGAFALLAACGSSSNGVSVATEAGATSVATTPGAAGTTPTADTTASGDGTTPVAGSDDTISVNDFSEMPPQCIELLGKFLKKIEPTASQIDWNTATVSQFEDFEKQFQADSDSFDAQSTAAGCDKYNLTGSDDKQFEQMAALAATEAPGAVGFINFLKSLSQSGTATGDVPSDCPGTIAAIEPFLTKGETMRDLTLGDVTRFGQLMTAISTNCTSDEASAFFARKDVTDFVNA